MNNYHVVLTIFFSVGVCFGNVAAMEESDNDTATTTDTTEMYNLSNSQTFLMVRHNDDPMPPLVDSDDFVQINKNNSDGSDSDDIADYVVLKNITNEDNVISNSSLAISSHDSPSNSVSNKQHISVQQTPFSPLESTNTSITLVQHNSFIDRINKFKEKPYVYQPYYFIRGAINGYCIPRVAVEAFRFCIGLYAKNHDEALDSLKNLCVGSTALTLNYLASSHMASLQVDDQQQGISTTGEDQQPLTETQVVMVRKKKKSNYSSAASLSGFTVGLGAYAYHEKASK